MPVRSGSGRRSPARVRKPDDLDALLPSCVREGRIGCCQGQVQEARGRKGEAVGQRQWSLRSPVLLRPQATRQTRDDFVGVNHGDGCGQQPVQLLTGGLRRVPEDPDEDVEGFREVDRAQDRRVLTVAQQPLDRLRGGLTGQERDDGERVENAQRLPRRRRSRAASSRRTLARACSLVSPRPRSEPFAAPIGSSGSGRTTSESPRSSTRTRVTPQRCRTSAGTDS